MPQTPQIIPNSRDVRKGARHPAEIWYNIRMSNGTASTGSAQAGRIVEVVGAIVRKDGRYLVGRRAAHKSQGGKWEFMGGKIEAGESPEQALARECREELDLAVENARFVDSVVHTYPDKTIRLTLLACTPCRGSEPKALEHSEIRWVTPAEMDGLDFSAADRELVTRLFGRKE